MPEVRAVKFGFLPDTVDAQHLSLIHISVPVREKTGFISEDRQQVYSASDNPSGTIPVIISAWWSVTFAASTLRAVSYTHLLAYFTMRVMTFSELTVS